MAQTLTEKKVLKKLGIPDFRYMTKDKVVSFASMLNRMDPVVAKKALEMLPEYTKLASEIVSVYQVVAEKILEQNSASVKTYYDALTGIIESLKIQLKNDNLSTEDRHKINVQMIEVARMIGEKDTENKKFLAAVAGWVGAGAVAISGVFLLIFGSKSSSDKG